ncbi:MAG: hypothetical protein IT258_09255 [Saprospiraceae bacterium]|nr:hypothetical protein [Saprospiraceae bacterium]
MKYLVLLLAAISLLNSACLKSAKALEGSFVGLGDKIMNDPSSKDARIMIVHGTGRKPHDYADRFVNRLVRKIAAQHDVDAKMVGEEKRITFNNIPGHIKFRKYQVGDRTIRFYVVNWSAVTAPLKDTLQANEKSQKLCPTLLGKSLKKSLLINEMSDFVFYAGYYKDEIRKPVYACMQLMYVNDDSLESFQPVKVDTILAKQLKSIELTNKSVYLVTGSIGSKVALDIMSNYAANTQEYNCNDSVCNYFSKDLKGIYMLSHQLPLLSNLYMKNHNNLGLSFREYYTYQNYFGVCRFLMKNPSVDSIDFVAFNDPNDLLGFKLIDDEPKCYCDNKINNDCNSSNEICIDAQKKINKVSCSVHNTRHLLWLASWIPAAHKRIYKNKKLVRILTRGVTPDGKLRKPTVIKPKL